jgi:hypothetical protein
MSLPFRSSLLGLSLALAAAACHGDGSLPIATGADGKPFVDADAITTTVSGGDFNGQSTVMLVSSFAGSCANEQNDVGVANGKDYFVELANVDASSHATAVTAPGTFTVTSDTTSIGALAMVTFEINDASCLPTTKMQATSGTVHVTQVDANGLVGTVDLTFEGGVEVSGSFDAAPCAAFDPTRSPGAGGTCQ